MIDGNREWYVPNSVVAKYQCETGDVNALVGRLRECVDVLDLHRSSKLTVKKYMLPGTRLRR